MARKHGAFFVVIIHWIAPSAEKINLRNDSQDTVRLSSNIEHIIRRCGGGAGAGAR